MYFALIGDIVNSKKIDNRYELQEKLSQYMEQLNKEYDEYLASGFSLTLGDEFQALFTNPKKIFEAIMKIEIEMKPIQFRFALGVGEILTNISKNKSMGSDGPAWWKARETIIELKKNHEKGLKEVSNIRIVGLKNQEVMDLINMSLSLCDHIEKKWTTQQRVIIEYVVQNYGLTARFTQSDLSTQLELSAPDLNKKLKLSNFYDYVGMLEKITKVLEKEIGGIKK